jgi:hypothetical protein
LPRPKRSVHPLGLRKPWLEVSWGAWESVHGGSRKWVPGPPSLSMPPSAPETRRPAACYPQRICGILATENRCPTRPLRGADQARAAIQAALAQIGICLPGTITIRPARRGKDPLNLRGQPAVPARPLHPVDPHRQRQDRHPAAHPGPVPGLRALVRQRPAAPGASRRTGSPVPRRNGQSRRLGKDHPRHAGTRPHQARPGPETAHTTQNAGRSARLTREQPFAGHL